MSLKVYTLYKLINFTIDLTLKFFLKFSKKFFEKKLSDFYKKHRSKNKNKKKFSKKPSNYSNYINYNRAQRGPKDGWNGLTLKILKFIITESKKLRKGITAKEISAYFRISDRVARYHIQKLLKLGLIQKCCNIKNCPFSNYLPNLNIVKSCQREHNPNFNNKTRIIHNAIINLYLKNSLVKTSNLEEILGYPRRTINYHLVKLQKQGLIIRAGGQRCKYAILIPSGTSIIHKHKYTNRHKYHIKSKNRTNPGPLARLKYSL